MNNKPISFWLSPKDVAKLDAILAATDFKSRSELMRWLLHNSDEQMAEYHAEQQAQKLLNKIRDSI